MAPSDPITSLQNPRVKQIVRLRERRHRDRAGVFIAEGVREVGRAMAAGLKVVEAFICPERLGVTPAELAALAAPRGNALYLVLVGTEKPGNLGAMIRTAAAAGCAGVLVAEANVDLWNPNCLRNSTGAVFDLPTVTADADEVRTWLAAHDL